MQDLEIRDADRKRVKIKIALSGVAGSGKTTSALLIAYGLCGDWNKIVIIDSDGGAADLYCHIPRQMGATDGQMYKVVRLSGQEKNPEDYSPERYMKAIDMCAKAGFAVIIVDGITQEWQYILDEVDKLKMSGSKFEWVEASKRHKELVKAIVDCNAHVIATIRRVTDWVQNENEKGKKVLEKIGLKDETKGGFDFEVTLHFTLDMKHEATAQKDRTTMFLPFSGQAKPFVPTIKTGQTIKTWCELEGGEAKEERKRVMEALDKCDTGEELGVLYDSAELLKDDQDFIAALKIRAELCVDNYKTAAELIAGWKGLPMLKNDTGLNKAFRRRCGEVAYLFDTVDGLIEYASVIWGEKQEVCPLPFIRDDQSFVNTVKKAKELILARPVPEPNPFADDKQQVKKVETGDGAKVEVVGDGTREKPLKKRYPKKNAEK